MKRFEGHINWLRTHLGVPYEASDRRFGPDYYDCSGLTAMGLHNGAELWLPPVLSWTQARWCYENGGEISVGQALSTPGALVFMGANRGLEGWGPNGHVATAVGDGLHVLETPSAGHKSGVSYAVGRRWSGAGLWPGMNENIGAEEPPSPPKTKALAIFLRGQAIEQLKPWAKNTFKVGMEGDGVRAVQNAVNFSMDEALVLDGDYGQATKAAVLRFQRAFFLGQPWEHDGQAGPHTNNGLIWHLLVRNQRDGA